MNEDIDTIIYLPSETDKVIITGLCNEIIDILEPLNIPQKAFALHQLLASFEDVSGIKATAIINKSNFDKEDEK